MAAHIDGKQAASLDVTGLAQKGGAVLSYLSIAPAGAPEPVARIAPGRADTLIAGDPIVAAGGESLAMCHPERTRAVGDSDFAPTAEFVMHGTQDFRTSGPELRVRKSVRALFVIEGRAKLLGLPEFENNAGLKDVVNALDEAEAIVRLIDATVAATGSAVVVGREAGDLAGGQLSIVGATYRNHGRNAGSVGVIGPTRMDYPKVVPLVTATANAMSSHIDRERESKGSRDDDD
jgi:Pyruvate/2-oxoacid:ferredoxin oxidoreductase gamma subunit